jgi:hypothetical protein
MDAIRVMPTEDQVVLERPTSLCRFIWRELVLILIRRAFDLMLYWGRQIFDSKTRDTTFE